MDSPIEKWRLRHAYPDAIGMWASATGAEAGELAFNAIAQDPRVLQRAARSQAIRMAARAEEFAESLAGTPLARSETWRAATHLVQHSIEAWRGTLKTYGRGPDLGFVAPEPALAVPEATDPWEVARRNLPAVDDETGRLASRLLHEFGVTLLRRARKPWDHVIMLAVLRYAARLLRGELVEIEPGHTGAAALADILALQSYAEETGLAPLSLGYSGRGKPIAQALSLLRDARTLRDAVRASPAGEARAAFWQSAFDFHAFAVVALDHHVLLDLPLHDAYEVAAAAIRQADAAIGSPEPVDMPNLPPSSASAPQVVRLHASACLPRKAADQPY